MVTHPALRRAACLLLAMATAACGGPSNPAPSAEQEQHAAAIAALQRLALRLRKEPLLRHVLDDGQVVYLAVAPCCDRFNDLYDALGNPVCAPSGGLSGAGDGRCPQLRAALQRSKGERVPNPFYKP